MVLQKKKNFIIGVDRETLRNHHREIFLRRFG